MDTRFRLDKSAFRMGKANDEWLQKNEYAALTPYERLRIAGYLIAAAYNFPEGEWPAMDKTLYSRRKR